MTRRICVITGTRADYGHLYWVLQALKEDPRCALTVIATGTHLSAPHGDTLREVEKGGYTSVIPVDIHINSDTGRETAHVLGRATSRLADAYSAAKADLVVLLGDRYEILAAAQAALVMRIPVAHIHGGEVTHGAFDDAIRHAITKMAHLHFTAAAAYAKRIRQMGEAPETIFTVGAPGLDHLEKTPPIPLDEISKEIGFDPKRPILLVTYHPETLDETGGARGGAALIAALTRFLGRATILCTGVNADPGHMAITALYSEFATNHPGQVFTVKSLGQARYLSVLRCAAAVVGNSSSGLIEAPAVSCPTVNIGRRQNGRLRAESIIDCDATETHITNAIERALSTEFQAVARQSEPPLGRGGASARIAETLATHPLENIIFKTFRDLEPGPA